RINREATSPVQNTNGSFTYSTLTPCIPTAGAPCTGFDNSYQSDLPSQFSLTVVNVPSLKYTLADVGLYAESDWKPFQNFTLRYGLRYEAQKPLKHHHDVAPRLSVAYGLGSGKGSPKTVLRGGFGLFYDRFTGNYVLNLERFNGVSTTAYTFSDVPAGASPNDPDFKADCIAGTTSQSQMTYEAAPNLRTAYITQFAGGFDQQ